MNKKILISLHLLLILIAMIVSFYPAQEHDTIPDIQVIDSGEQRIPPEVLQSDKTIISYFKQNNVTDKFFSDSSNKYNFSLDNSSIKHAVDYSTGEKMVIIRFKSLNSESEEGLFLIGEESGKISFQKDSPGCQINNEAITLIENGPMFFKEECTSSSGKYTNILFLSLGTFKNAILGNESININEKKIAGEICYKAIGDYYFSDLDNDKDKEIVNEIKSYQSKDKEQCLNGEDIKKEVVIYQWNKESSLFTKLSSNNQLYSEVTYREKPIRISRMEGGNIYAIEFTGGENELVIGTYGKDGIIISVDPKTKISFAGDIEKLTPLYYNGFRYGHVEVSTSLSYAYADKEDQEKALQPIRYGCDKRIFEPRQGELNEYHYCEVINDSLISQYLFTSLITPTQLTGGDYLLYKWNKVYVKKVKDKDIFFVLPLSVIANNIDSEKYSESNLAKITIDDLLRDPQIKSIISEADEFVKKVKGVE